MGSWKTYKRMSTIGVGAGPAGQVLAGPLQGKNEVSFLQKASNEQKC